MIKSVEKYFPELSEVQIEKLTFLYELFKTHNKNINLISRNSLKNFYVEHVLHSISISKIKFFKKNELVLDICLLYTSPSPRDGLLSRMPSSA